MPNPRLIHPCSIHIRQILKSSTFFDEDAREPVQHAQRSAIVVLPGQVKWEAQKNLIPDKAGVVEGAAGYVLFRVKYMNAASVTLNLNDRFTKMGHVETDVYVVKLEWTAHYPKHKGPTMLKAWFADRQPAKQTRGD
jgi:hypothetical protein